MTDTPAVIGRNDPCPCGSGLKAKRCHPALVGASVEQLARAAALVAAQSELAGLEGYRPPGPTPDELAAGWSIENFRHHGCPYHLGPYGPACARDDSQLGGCAAGCGR